MRNGVLFRMLAGTPSYERADALTYRAKHSALALGSRLDQLLSLFQNVFRRVVRIIGFASAILKQRKLILREHPLADLFLWNRCLPHNWPSPAAEAPVRATQCRASGRKSLDGRWSGGYFRHRCPPLCLQHVHGQQPPRLPRTTAEGQRFPLVADPTRVRPQQPVNTSVFAPCGCRPLIPLTFPPGNRGT